MYKSFVIAVMLISSVSISGVFVQPAEAQIKGFGYNLPGKRITHARGKSRPASCNALRYAHPSKRLWQGAFLGSTEDVFDRTVRVGGVFCFPSRQACQSWIYDMQSVNDGPIRANSCRPV